MEKVCGDTRPLPLATTTQRTPAPGHAHTHTRTHTHHTLPTHSAPVCTLCEAAAAATPGGTMLERCGAAVFRPSPVPAPPLRRCLCTGAAVMAATASRSHTAPARLPPARSHAPTPHHPRCLPSCRRRCRCRCQARQERREVRKGRRRGRARADPHAPHSHSPTPTPAGRRRAGAAPTRATPARRTTTAHPHPHPLCTLWRRVKLRAARRRRARRAPRRCHAAAVAAPPCTHQYGTHAPGVI